MSNSDPTLFERLAKVEPAKLARLLVELAAQDQTILEQVQLLLASGDTAAIAKAVRSTLWAWKRSLPFIHYQEAFAFGEQLDRLLDSVEDGLLGPDPALALHFITFGQKGAFSLTTPTQEESEAEPLQNFFPERHYVPLLEVLATVNRYSSFLNEFQHWQQRHHRGRPSPKTFYAGLIGIGCTIGSRKMARISHSINESELKHTINWYFSVDNTHAANDQVLRLIDRLELPNISRRSSDRLHTSSDGQKFEVRAESLNANYSFKYFGKGQGGREALLQAIANGSLVSWQHINLLGEYDFSDDKLQDSVGIKPPKLAA